MAKSDCIIFLNPENFHLIFRDRKLIATKRRMTILLQKLKSHGMEKPFKAMTISIVTHSRLHPNFQNIGVRFRIAWEPKRHSNAPHSDRFTKNCAPDCCDLMCVHSEGDRLCLHGFMHYYKLYQNFHSSAPPHTGKLCKRRFNSPALSAQPNPTDISAFPPMENSRFAISCSCAPAQLFPAFPGPQRLDTLGCTNTQPSSMAMVRITAYMQQFALCRFSISATTFCFSS